jgi:hypothetical protein
LQRLPDQMKYVSGSNYRYALGVPFHLSGRTDCTHHREDSKLEGSLNVF